MDKVKIFKCSIGSDFYVELPLDKHSVEIFEQMLPIIEKDIKEHIRKQEAKQGGRT